MNEILDLVPIWTLILGFGIFFYVLLDGFDLGVGMLFGFAPDSRSRNTIMNSIAPVWDGNETCHAACAGVPRCGVRVPLARFGTQNVLGLRLLLRLGHRDLRARRRAWLLHPGF